MKLKKFFSPQLHYAKTEETSLLGQDSLLSPPQVEDLFQFSSQAQADLLGCVLLSLRPFLQCNRGDTEVRFNVVKQFAQEAVHKAPGFLPFAKMLLGQRVGVHSVLLFFSLSQKHKLEFTKGAALLRLSVRDNLHLSFAGRLDLQLAIEMGCSVVSGKRPDNAELTAFKAVSDAMRSMSAAMEPTCLPLNEELKTILEQDGLPLRMEPLVELQTGNILGWEPCFSLPEKSRFSRMEALLLFAAETGSITELNYVCSQLGLQQAERLNKGQRLFLDIHPEALRNGFSVEALLDTLPNFNLEPKDLVLELTDSTGGFYDRPFVDALREYKKRGLSIGLDELNTNTLKLELLRQLRPEFLKLNVSRAGAENSGAAPPIRELLAIAEVLNAKLIATGVDSVPELHQLAAMDVFAAQGSILTQSAGALPDSRRELAEFSCTDAGVCRSPIRELAVLACTVTPETPVSRIQSMLQDQAPLSQVVVVSGLRPVGLIMKYTLDDHLSTKFGLSLYGNRPIARLMDTDFLQVEAEQALEEVAQKAMKRPDEKLYDDIVVTENGELYGLLSVQRMLDKMAQMQLEIAKGANPLTGLPGNVAIETTIEKRAKVATPTSLAYVDLDNFKVYNDAYGFEYGDRIIQLTARSLSEAMKKHARNNGLLGHVGGDDFVIIAAPEHVEAVCRCAIELFAKEVPKFYTEEDRNRGYIAGTGRNGKKGHFDLVSLSIGILDCVFSSSFSMCDLSRTVANVKKNAKAVPGNSCVRESVSPGSAK